MLLLFSFRFCHPLPVVALWKVKNRLDSLEKPVLTELGQPTPPIVATLSTCNGSVATCSVGNLKTKVLAEKQGFVWLNGTVFLELPDLQLNPNIRLKQNINSSH